MFPSEFRTAVVAAVGATLTAVGRAPPAPPGVDQQTWDNATKVRRWRPRRLEAAGPGGRPATVGRGQESFRTRQSRLP